MKKIIAVSLVAFTTALGLGASSTEAKGWYAGAGAAWKSGNYKGTLSSQNPGFRSVVGSGKGTLSGSDFFGTLFAGHTFEHSNFNWFVQANGAMDLGNKLSQTVNLPATSGMTAGKMFVERLGTAGLDLGIGKEFKGVNVSLKAGLLVGRFSVKVQDLTPTNANFSNKNNSIYVPGFAPGVGVEKRFGSFDVGFKYEYQMYAQLKSNSFDPGQQNSITTAANPRYHVLALTVKKEF